APFIPRPWTLRDRRPDDGDLAFGSREASHLGSGTVSALNGQPVSFCGHDEVVPMEAADLVGPPGHRDASPLGEKGGMVPLRLGKRADPVGERQRISEAWEAEAPLELGNAVAHHQLPV